VLITGGSGYLGRELVRRARGPVVATRLGGGVDIRDTAAVRRSFEEVRPRAVIHTAYRQDDRATTLDGSVAVAEAAAGVGARLVHLSTDVLFDGEKHGPYVEEDEPRPLTEYGRAKADAERGVAQAHPEALIVRTSLLYGGPGAEPGHHECVVLDAAAGRSDMAFFADELRCPVQVGDLAAALLELVDGERSGVLHVAGADTLDRHEFARLVAVAHGVDPAGLRRSTIASTGLDRPRNCALSSERARAVLQTRVRGAREVLQS